jgi:EmrB/QacA subfamily drug resistance transporter
VRAPQRIPYKWIVAIVYVFGLFIDILDTTIVNVALPTLSREFHADTHLIEWVVLGYLLSLAVWIPASGWIGDRFGTKKTFLTALGMFVVASMLCGLSRNLGQLITFRVIQGVGGVMLNPVGVTMLFRAFRPEERAKASAVLIVPTVLAPAAGPLIGGLLVDHASWRWIFYVNLPVGIVAFLIGAVFLREHREASAGRFDVGGFVLSGLGLVLVLYALSQGPSRGWASAEVLATAVGGVACFVVLVLVERRPEPMLALRLFRDRMFRNANLASLFSFGSLFGLIFVLPLFLQGLRGLSAFDSGLATAPQAIGVIVSSQIAGRLYPIVGPRRLVAGGLVFVAITQLGFQWVRLDTSLWWIGLLMFTRGIGSAFSFVPLQAATFATIRTQDTGRASALYNTQRQVAAALGTALFATTLISRTNHRVAAVAPSAGQAAVTHARLLGFHDAFLVATIMAGLAALAALLIHDEDAAETMRRRAKAKAGADLSNEARPAEVATVVVAEAAGEPGHAP